MAEDSSPSGGILGFFLGMVIAAGVYIAVMLPIGADLMTALIVAAVAAVIGATYGAIAFSKKVLLRIGLIGPASLQAVTSIGAAGFWAFFWRWSIRPR